MINLENPVMRLLYFNQYKILSLLDPINRSSYGYYMDILVEGIQKRYPDILEMVNAEGIRVDVSDEVDLILEMFAKLEKSLDCLPDELRNDLVDKYHVYFGGFDCSSKVEHHCFIYYNFLKRHQKVNIQKRTGMHANLSLHHYRQMAVTYRSLGYVAVLSAEQIRRVCIRKGRESQLLRPIHINFPEPWGAGGAQLVKEERFDLEE
ncbi:YfbU family protein [Salinicoccus sp. ID82-1]|uniref:YfbU family protein n=1 Tax=Salinicoccus sp. ID82-1 TaxID=2820269 RepID=UPI001F3C1247|nr:YfbU family protein [Salinicoccus sp. ID82-1]MCG1010614.1 YfbU family protein [Salinicoccus sp. ID82-1]